MWKWRIPYFYCHFTERLQHSGYLRLMEEVVDRFLASRGISIQTMLETRRWIPVVPNARLEILSEALMEETIYTVYTVKHIFKDVTYTSRMDCYVPRNNMLVHTATGQITHGYAEILNRRDWALINFDERHWPRYGGRAKLTEPATRVCYDIRETSPVLFFLPQSLFMAGLAVYRGKLRYLWVRPRIHPILGTR